MIIDRFPYLCKFANREIEPPKRTMEWNEWYWSKPARYIVAPLEYPRGWPRRKSYELKDDMLLVAVGTINNSYRVVPFEGLIDGTIPINSIYRWKSPRALNWLSSLQAKYLHPIGEL